MTSSSLKPPRTTYAISVDSQWGGFTFYRLSRASLAAQRRWFAKRHPDLILLGIEVSKEHQIYEEVKAAGGAALAALRAKANWEKMVPVNVIVQWGDPREWPSVKEQKGVVAS